MRFVLPALPALALLTADAIVALEDAAPRAPVGALAAALVAVGAAHCVYYGVLFAPLHSDVDASLLRVAAALSTAPLPYPLPPDVAEVLSGPAHHFGVGIPAE